MAERIAIIGDGQMGLVLGALLKHQGHDVVMWGPCAEHVEVLQSTRHSPSHLPEFRLPDGIVVTTSAKEALEGATVILDAIPTQYIRRVWEQLREFVPAKVPVLSVSKGIEAETLLSPLQIIADVMGESHDLSGRASVCVSGPTIAAELAEEKPATMVAASHDADAALLAQSVLSNHWLRVYTNDDVMGVEVAGATKNVIALAAGMIDGLEIGYNAKSALLARGLAEIVRLGVSMGANCETFFGVAGVGDLATTCFCPMGRNRTCGERLGKGESLDDILDSTASVIEGVPTTKSVMQLAAKQKVDMPITKAVHAILFEELEPSKAIDVLMERELKAERVG